MLILKVRRERKDARLFLIKMVLKALKPSKREKKRYLVFEIISKSLFDFNVVSTSLNQGLHEFLGDLGLAQAGARIMPDCYKDNKGIIRVNNKYADHVKSALLFLQNINNKGVIVRTICVSGMINKAKKCMGC